MTRYKDLRDAAIYSLIVFFTYIFLQTVIVIVHEHIHSSTAWLLGHMDSPLDIIWGNPVTLVGWDEGVSYSDLFAGGMGTDAAIIAVMPLIFHAIIVSCGIYLLLSNIMQGRRWGFHFVFWLVVINLEELIAYMPFRAFLEHGDIGNINHGLGLSPWILFFPGVVLILVWLYYLYGRVLPATNVVIAKDSLPIRYIILVGSAFALFLWTSGLRLVYSYPPGDPQWVLGLVAFVSFFLVVWLCRPGNSWVVEAEVRVVQEIQAE